MIMMTYNPAYYPVLMEKAGLQAGDILVAADQQPLTGMPDWFVARAHFGLHQPTELLIQRGGQMRSLKVVITEPAWRTWSTRQFSAVVAFSFVRLILLLLAIAVGFSRPERLRARLVAVMLAVGAVAEGYPSSG